MPDKTFLSR